MAPNYLLRGGEGRGGPCFERRGKGGGIKSNGKKVAY